MAALINLTAEQISSIRGYVASGNIAGGYSYVQSIIGNANAAGDSNTTAASSNLARFHKRDNGFSPRVGRSLLRGGDNVECAICESCLLTISICSAL